MALKAANAMQQYTRVTILHGTRRNQKAWRKLSACNASANRPSDYANCEKSPKLLYLEPC
eukprot:4070120-Pyramimonas_sp.AAC.1